MYVRSVSAFLLIFEPKNRLNRDQHTGILGAQLPCTEHLKIYGFASEMWLIKSTNYYNIGIEIDGRQCFGLWIPTILWILWLLLLFERKFIFSVKHQFSTSFIVRNIELCRTSSIRIIMEAKMRNEKSTNQKIIIIYDTHTQRKLAPWAYNWINAMCQFRWLSHQFVQHFLWRILPVSFKKKKRFIFHISGQFVDKSHEKRKTVICRWPTYETVRIIDSPLNIGPVASVQWLQRCSNNCLIFINKNENQWQMRLGLVIPDQLHYTMMASNLAGTDFSA